MVSHKSENLFQLLTGKRFVPDQELKKRKFISTSEKGTKYILNLGRDGKNSVAFQVDGYIITDGSKCDKLILIDLGANSWCEILVELKSHRNTSKAIEQLENTLSSGKLFHVSNKIVRARIVAQAFPCNRANPEVERAKQRFRARYNCELKNIKSHQPDNLI